MSWKPKKSTHDTLFDETETKLLVSGSKPQIHEGFLSIHKEIKLESIRRKFNKTSVFIDNSLICI